MAVHFTPFTTAAGIQNYAQLDPLPFNVAPSIGKCTCLLRGTIYAYKPRTFFAGGETPCLCKHTTANLPYARATHLISPRSPEGLSGYGTVS